MPDDLLYGVADAQVRVDVDAVGPTQLARQFEERPEVRFGLTTMCIGIGMGGTVIWENPSWKGAAA